MIENTFTNTHLFIREVKLVTDYRVNMIVWQQKVYKKGNTSMVMDSNMMGLHYDNWRLNKHADSLCFIGIQQLL